MSDYKFEMPWPPTVNHYHQPAKINGKIRIVKGKDARQYAKYCESHLAEVGVYNERIPEDATLSMTLILHPPTNRKYDVDNRTKGIMDALSNANFYADDSQISQLKIIKGEKVKGGSVEVFISKLN